MVRLYEGASDVFIVGFGNLSGFSSDSDLLRFRKVDEEEGREERDGERERGWERERGGGEDLKRKGVFFCSETILYFWGIHNRVSLSLPFLDLPLTFPPFQFSSYCQLALFPFPSISLTPSFLQSSLSPLITNARTFRRNCSHSLARSLNPAFFLSLSLLPSPFLANLLIL